VKIDVEFYEKVFLGLTGVALLVMLGALFVTLGAHGGHVPEPAGRVDPKTVLRTPPFDRPGVTREAPGRYRAVMVARTWSFTPAEVRVPEGSTVDFRVVSPDVVHGFRINGTNVNAMVLPGEVTRVEHTFAEPGEYLLVCHEYCGIAHQAMFGRVVVEPAGGAVPARRPSAGSGHAGGRRERGPGEASTPGSGGDEP
jgi:cytochrome c oxidase subunit 2